MEAFLIDFWNHRWRFHHRISLVLSRVNVLIKDIKDIRSSLVWLTDARSRLTEARKTLISNQKKSMEAFSNWFWNHRWRFHHRISLVLEPRERAYHQRHQRYPVILGVTDWRAPRLTEARASHDFKSKESMEAFLIDFLKSPLAISTPDIFWSWSRVNVLIKDIKDIRSSLVWLTDARSRLTEARVQSLISKSKRKAWKLF